MTAINSAEQQQVAQAAQQAQEPRYRTAKVAVPAQELRAMLNRALGTLEPAKWPQWCHDIMGGNTVRGADGRSSIYEGVLPTDECTFQFRRRVDENPSS